MPNMKLVGKTGIDRKKEQEVGSRRREECERESAEPPSRRVNMPLFIALR